MSTCGTCGVEMNENEKYCKACGDGSPRDEVLNQKKSRVMTQGKTWVKPAAIAAAVIVAVGALWLAKDVSTSQKTGKSSSVAPHRDASARTANAALVKEEGGSVNIPIKILDDGKAHFFAFASGGKTITFFVIKAGDGSIRAAFDACKACNHAKLGYREEGGLMVCNNCGMGFQPTGIGTMSGGCNPIPVNKTVDERAIMLKVRDLDAGAQYF